MTDAQLVIEVDADEPVVGFRRFVDAPPEVVFAAWTEPDHLRHWWGPPELVLVTCECDARVAGLCRFVHRAHDGTEYAFSGEYREVDRPRRLVRTFAYDGAPLDSSLETLTFQPEASGTLVVSKSVFPSFAARNIYTNAGMQIGLRASQARLDAWLEATRIEWRT